MTRNINIPVQQKLKVYSPGFGWLYKTSVGFERIPRMKRIIGWPCKLSDALGQTWFINAAEDSEFSLFLILP